MRTRVTVAVLVVVLGFYAVLIGTKGVAMMGSGDPVGIGLGIATFLVPVIGGYLVWREIQFGRRSAALADQLAAERALPLDDLPRRSSGRVDRGAADHAFAARRADVEESPEDWRRWYRLALAYDDAGDRARARAATRRAIALHDEQP